MKNPNYEEADLIAVEHDWSGPERREYERHSVEFYLCVYEQGGDAPLGHVVDISLGGMRLLSEQPIPAHRRFDLRMDASLESGKRETVEFSALSVWAEDDVNDGFHNAGFQFQDLSPSASRSIQQIIDELSG